MKTNRASLSALAAGLLGFSLQAQSAITAVTIDAGVRTSDTHASCVFPVPAFTDNDCSYNASAPFSAPGQNWIGPGYLGTFYALGTAPNDSFGTRPVGPADGRIGIALSGIISIDDKDSPAACSTHSISGVVQMEPFSRHYETQASIFFVENHPEGLTQTIVDRVVDGGTPNGAGGCDYVLGSAGAPDLLSTGSDVFPGQVPYAISSPPSAGPTDWLAPDDVGLAPFEGGANTGLAAQEVTIGAGFECLSAVATPCAPSGTSWNTGARATWDNILGTISTDADNNITASTLFLVHVVGVAGPPTAQNSWVAYTANVTGTGPGGAAPDAVDDAAATDLPDPVVISVLANDTDFVDPVTVTATVPGDGTAVVTGSPGPAAGISITYTPTGTGNYVDTFDYTVTDNDGATDTATVTVTVTDPSVDNLPTANPGTITIATVGVDPSTAPGTVNVANIAGNALGDAPATVTATAGATGTTTVAGNVVTYTPAATFFAGSDTFNYTITDNDGDEATAAVTVTIADASPTVADDSETGDQDTVLNASGAFTAGNGSVAQHTLAVQTQAGDGSCAATVSGANIAVAYTPDAGFVGSDSCVVRLTDGDGDFDDGTFSFTVEEVIPEDDIKLPGGSSSLDLWSLALLGALPLVRRRHRLS